MNDKTGPLSTVAVDLLVSGELLPAGTVMEVAGTAMCGHCRADLDRATFYDGLQITCHRCGEPLWFEVSDGQIIQHPGKQKQIADRGSQEDRMLEM